jgi:hypothetical protein
MSWWLVHRDHWDEIVVYQENDRERRDNQRRPQREITNNPDDCCFTEATTSWGRPPARTGGLSHPGLGVA